MVSFKSYAEIVYHLYSTLLQTSTMFNRTTYIRVNLTH